jgi:hypothetical protein
MLRLYAENISGFPVLSSPLSLLGNDIAGRVFADVPSITLRVSHPVYARAYRYMARSRDLSEVTMSRLIVETHRNALSQSSRVYFIMLWRNIGEISSREEKDTQRDVD